MNEYSYSMSSILYLTMSFISFLYLKLSLDVISGTFIYLLLYSHAWGMVNLSCNLYLISTLLYKEMLILSIETVPSYDWLDFTLPDEFCYSIYNVCTLNSFVKLLLCVDCAYKCGDKCYYYSVDMKYEMYLTLFCFPNLSICNVYSLTLYW